MVTGEAHSIKESGTRRVVGAVHARTVFARRLRVLSSAISEVLAEGAQVLDVGCGSGELASALIAIKPGLQVEGVDVLVRPNTAIPVRKYDGEHLPFPDQAFDYAMLVDVLHHTDDPASLLAEVSRVARHVVIKDHYRNGFLAGLRLRIMDWVGNAPHGVRLPYNYLSRDEWAALWRAAGLRIDRRSEALKLYPFPADGIFGRGLHF